MTASGGDIKTAVRQKRSVFCVAVMVVLFICGVPAALIYREQRNGQLNRALISAVYRNDEREAVYLLRSGADANALDDRSPPPSLGQLLAQMLDRLRGKHAVGMSNAHTALQVAVWDYWQISYRMPDNAPIVRALLANGADARRKDNDGETVLTLALKSEHTSNMRPLLEYGASPNDRGADSGMPILALAALNEQADVRLLLDYGADPDATGWGGRTALMCATYVKDPVPVLTLLLAHGATINQQDDIGMTALMFACERDDEDMLRCLLAHGAAVNLRTKRGETAMQIAQEARRRNLIELLRGAGATTGDELSVHPDRK